MDELSLQSPPRLLKVLVVYFLLTQCYRDTASSPVISLLGIDRNRGAVILNCDSNSWYPEPEVVWLDGEGNLLSAGPTETVRGPDDLYTVSSRVTVEKRHSNNFTCRVQQKDINQTRETHIYVPDDSFTVQLSPDWILIIGTPVCIIVLIIVITLIIYIKWKQRMKRRDDWM
ncbi:butyrophilin subfamily 2 member A2-like [Morone saxatilis]|uniref:butyrophilin subfamily 2 member A2-like n=1 Tax=Morone saxatilis TaxID=34816 RepID=UPI0015E21BF9|nr:butyrophilin subfamily 2 member A2-like [Morone saxatilis]